MTQSKAGILLSLLEGGQLDKDKLIADFLDSEDDDIDDDFSLGGDARRNGTYLTQYHIDNLNQQWNHPDKAVRDKFRSQIKTFMNKAQNADNIDDEMYYMERLFNNSMMAQNIMKQYNRKEWKNQLRYLDFMTHNDTGTANDAGDYEFDSTFLKAHQQGNGQVVSEWSYFHAETDTAHIYMLNSGLAQLYNMINEEFKSYDEYRKSQAASMLTFFILTAGFDINYLKFGLPLMDKVNDYLRNHKNDKKPSITMFARDMNIPDQFHRKVVDFIRKNIKDLLLEEYNVKDSNIMKALDRITKAISDGKQRAKIKTKDLYLALPLFILKTCDNKSVTPLLTKYYGRPGSTNIKDVAAYYLKKINADTDKRVIKLINLMIHEYYLEAMQDIIAKK